MKLRYLKVVRGSCAPERFLIVPYFFYSLKFKRYKCSTNRYKRTILLFSFIKSDAKFISVQLLFIQIFFLKRVFFCCFSFKCGRRDYICRMMRQRQPRIRGQSFKHQITLHIESRITIISLCISAIFSS